MGRSMVDPHMMMLSQFSDSALISQQDFDDSMTSHGVGPDGLVIVNSKVLRYTRGERPLG
jgi:hypothetical protein